MRHRPKPSASGSSTSASVSRRTSVPVRSEEHTSELQSQSNLVCRLLLEKKNKNSTHSRTITRRYLSPRDVTLASNKTVLSNLEYQRLHSTTDYTVYLALQETHHGAAMQT